MAERFMKVLDRTFPSPEENLACDEALLEACEAGFGEETLRFWEPRQTFAVLGYSNKVETELKKEACHRDGVPILRRISGGGTVLQGPGCLNYALILEIKNNPELSTVTRANCFIMNRNKEALARLLKKEVTVEGHTDLAMNGLKFSGNSQRRKRRFLLFHGTFLLRFDFGTIERYLSMPSQAPAYRKDLPHTAFLINLKTPSSDVKIALQKIWSAGVLSRRIFRSVVRDLVAKVYSKDEWNLKF